VFNAMFSAKGNDKLLHRFDASSINDRLDLSRRDLCLAMSVLGCDFSGGAKGMGPVRIRKLIRTLKVSTKI
jgi:hypothetical protein